MKLEEFSNVVMAVIAICALFVPLLTAIVNNHHQLKVRELELRHQDERETYVRKQKIIDEYALALGRYSRQPTQENLANYSSAYCVAFIHVSPKSQSTMEGANNTINGYLSGDFDLSSIANTPSVVIDALSAELKTTGKTGKQKTHTAHSFQPGRCGLS